MKKKLFSLVMGTLSIFVLIACSSNNNSSSISKDKSSEQKISEEKHDLNKNNYIVPDYNSWNHENLEDYSKVKVSGEIVQAMYDSGAAQIRIAMNKDYDQMILATISKDIYEDVITEGDVVTLYGYSQGRYTYESVFGAEITIPFMEVAMYEGYHSEDYASKILYDENGIKLEQTNFDSFKLSNNSGQVIKSHVKSVDVDGQVISTYALNDLDYTELNDGQWKEAFLNDSDDILKKDKTINIVITLENSDYDEIGNITFTVILEKDVL